MNNKGRRNELTMLKYKKRLKMYGLKPGDHNTVLKSHSVPCSCGLCRSEKYRDTKRQKNKVIDYEQ